MGGVDEHPAAVSVQVAVGPDGDAEEVAQATLQLRRELLNLDVDAIEVPGAGVPQPGSRAVDVAALGALVVNLADPQLLAAVVATVRSWLTGLDRGRLQTVTLVLGAPVDREGRPVKVARASSEPKE